MTAIVIAAILIGAIVVFWEIGLWRYFLMCFAALLDGYELASVKLTGKSLSQSFWAFHQQNETEGWLIISGLALVCCLWLLHLAWKQIRRKS